MNDGPVLTGLAKQLVLAELLDEKSAKQAHAQAQRNKISLVTYLVQNRLVKSRALAEVAADQFGVAFVDLSALDKESQPKDLVAEKLARQHRVIPLWRRGNKLFVGISDPTNHQAVTDIQFSTGLNTEAVLVEDDKLGDAIEKFYDSGSGGLDGDDLDLDIETVNDSGPEAEENQEADDAPVVR
ncbi:MAG: type IV-A pilus assembly ATPase PilB, partial [Pseudomonas sp.]